MTLSSVQFLRSIVPAYAADAGSLHGLGIQYPRARLGIAPCSCAYPLAQRGVDLLPGAVQAPHPEVMMHRRPRRELAWKHAPLAAASQDVEDGVEDLTKAVDPRPSTSFRRGQMRLDVVPFSIGEVCWVRLSHAS